jgi:metal-responsive CopG/Arc/MetJ family transcriptional regulator
MKTAISIPDGLFTEVEKTAKKLGIPRSQLFAKAVEEFIANHNPRNITSQINHLLENENLSIDSRLAAMQITTMCQESSDESW